MVLVYSPKYALKNEICAVAICDSGYPEERTFPLNREMLIFVDISVSTTKQLLPL